MSKVNEKMYRAISIFIGLAVLIISSLFFAESAPAIPVVLFAAVLIIGEIFWRRAKKAAGESIYGEAWGSVIDDSKDDDEDDEDWMYDDDNDNE